MKKFLVAFCMAFFLFCIAVSSLGNTFSLYLENDNVVGNDRHYTHGTRLTYFFDENLYLSNFFGCDVDVTAISVGQHLYTPSDISLEELMEDDRPYGGWLYVGFMAMMYDEKDFNLLELDVGVVGPMSMAEDTQRIIHEWTNSKEPMGWDNQISNEPAINLVYQRKRKVKPSEYFDIIPHAGGSIGNPFTYINAGGIFRVGYNIPDDYGSLRMEPTVRAKCLSDDFSVYLLGSVDSRFVLWNAFLDGNMFSDSHSVDKRELVTDFTGGIGLACMGYSMSYCYTYRTKEFDLQEEENVFGSITLSKGF